jgi:hypothetical protein
MFLFTETLIASNVFRIIIGIHDSKARRDMNIKVFVKRRLCKALFCRIEGIRRCSNVLQMRILQTQMTNVRVKVYGTQNEK